MKVVNEIAHRKELDSFLKERPVIVYKPEFCSIFGSVIAGLLASNLIYWSSKVGDKEFYKTDKDLISELRCGRKAFMAAKEKLLSTKAFKVEYRGLPRRTYYTVNLVEVLELIKRCREQFSVSSSPVFVRDWSLSSGVQNPVVGSDDKEQPVVPKGDYGVDQKALKQSQNGTAITTITTTITSSNTTSKIISSNKQHTNTLVGIGAAPQCGVEWGSLFSRKIYKKDSIQLNDKDVEEISNPDNQENSQTKPEALDDVKKDTPPLRPKPNQKTSPRSRIEEIEAIFQYWKDLMNHPRARMDEKRKKLISDALKLGYDSDEIKIAILGCSRTPFNMGENDRGQVYDDLHIILRGAHSIDRFCKNAFNPPKVLTKSEKLLRSNIEAGLRFKERLMQRERDRMAKEAEFKSAGSDR